MPRKPKRPTLTCFCCGRQLDNLDPLGNQPSGGSEFTSYGHYGSAVTDTMDGVGFAINVCDKCLKDRYRRVLRIVPNKMPRRPPPSYEEWRP